MGGGITGTSVACHLAKAGLTDAALVEKGQPTSGSTCHAAGLVTQFNHSPSMMRFRRYSIELYTELGVFERVGGLRIASSPEQPRSPARPGALGVTVLAGTRVTGIELGGQREIAAVATEAGRLECELVVNAAGIRAP